MLTFYLCFLAGGAVLPVLSFALGFLSDASSDTSLDTTTGSEGHTKFNDIHSDMDIHSDSGTSSFVSIGLLPTSMLSISALAITFGATGALVMLDGKGKLLSFIFAIVFGYIASVIVQTILNSLKKLQTINNGIFENELLLYEGKVIDTILPGQMGTVSFVTLKNILVSYPAKCEDPNLKLVSGRIVKVREFKNGICIVEPKNKYE